jgi:Ca2+-dependent lipid-binding protein
VSTVSSSVETNHKHYISWYVDVGFLRVDLLDGKDLRAMDRNGKSDPYAVFTLNGEKVSYLPLTARTCLESSFFQVFRSEIQKKTLNPVWKENFECQIPSRVAADFRVDLYDWDLNGKADKMGRCQIDLKSLEPFHQQMVTLPVYDIKTDQQHGTIRISLVFKPAFISKQRGQ